MDRRVSGLGGGSRCFQSSCGKRPAQELQFIHADQWSVQEPINPLITFISTRETLKRLNDIVPRFSTCLYKLSHASCPKSLMSHVSTHTQKGNWPFFFSPAKCNISYKTSCTWLILSLETHTQSLLSHSWWTRSHIWCYASECFIMLMSPVFWGFWHTLEQVNGLLISSTYNYEIRHILPLHLTEQSSIV